MKELEVGKRYRIVNTKDNVEHANIALGVFEGTLIESGMLDCEGDMVTFDVSSLILMQEANEELPDKYYWLAFDEPGLRGGTVYGILSKAELSRLEEI